MEKWILILLAIFSFGQLLRLSILNGVVVNLFDIVVIIFVIFWIIKQIFNNRLRLLLNNSLTKPLFIFIFICLISLISNSYRFNLQELAVSFLYLVRFISYACVFFIIANFNLVWRQRIFLTFLASVFLMILAGFIQYIYYPNLRNLNYLEWDEHLYRMFSTLLDPNFLAVFINIFLFSLMTLIISQKVLFKRLFITLLYIIGFIALLLTYSRSGFIMFAIGSIVNLLLLKKNNFILALVIFFIVGVSILPQNFGGEGVNLRRTASIAARSESAKQALTIIKDNPIFGVGFNTYRYIQRDYGFISKKDFALSHSASGTDNSFLFVLATTGIVGFIAYLYLWYRMLRITLEAYRSNINYNFEKLISVIAFSSFIGIFVNSMFINSLFYAHVLFVIWIFIGLLKSPKGVNLKVLSKKADKLKVNTLL